MHVKSSSQNKFPMSLGTYRNKPHSKPMPEVPPATSPVSLGRRADDPRPTVGQSASYDPQHRASAQKYVPRIFYGGQSDIHRRTVRRLLPTFTQNRGVSGSHPELVRRTVRPPGPDGPRYYSSTVDSLDGLSTWACIILYNSYKIEYNSDWCETILLISYWRSLPVKNMFAPKIIILFSSLIKYVFTLLIT